MLRQLRHHHPQMSASTICQRLQLLEAMGRVEHVPAFKHNSLQPESLVHAHHPHWFGLKDGFCTGAGGSTGLSAPLPIQL